MTTEGAFHRADCPELNLRAVEIATAKLIAAVRDGTGCRWCAARVLQQEFSAYSRLRRPAADITRSMRAHVAGVLANEPPPRTRCRSCCRARRTAQYEGGNCPTHAQCAECRGERVH